MTTTWSKLTILLFFLLILLAPSVLVAQESLQQERFARYLYGRGDFFRAIGEYERVRFDSLVTDDRETLLLATERIGLAYYRAGRPLTAIEELSSLQVVPDGSSRPDSLLYLGLSYLSLENPVLANTFIQRWLQSTGRDESIYLGYLNAKLGDYDGAVTAFNDSRTDGNSGTVAAALALTAQYTNRQRKSPFLAGLLSALVPGTGQFYSGHFYDGFQALGMVSALGLVSYAMYRYDTEVRDGYLYFPISLGVTALFHGANIWGATRTAGYRNLRVQQDYEAALRDVVLSPPLPGEPTGSALGAE